MKPDIAHPNFAGKAEADLSDYLSVAPYHGNLDDVGKYFNLDEARFTVIGVDISSVEENFYISLFCIDKKKSTDEKEHRVKILITENFPNLGFLFKTLSIVLHASSDKKYSDLDYHEEVRYEDVHK